MVVQVILTPKIQRAIETILTSEELSDKFRAEIEKFTPVDSKYDEENSRGIPFETVRKCHQHMTKDYNPLYLHELLDESDIYFPPLPKPKRNPELVARLERLKAQQANREYKQMTKGVDNQIIGSQNTFAEFGTELRSVKKQVLAVFNSFVTVICAFVFGYMAAYYTYQPTAFCILVGLIMSTIVALADIYFIAKTVI
ncbi:vacuolar ATPase assembly protein VMA12-like [Saccoglossus kowalevskii]|uniref:Transmembrane protein 199-like n=1 Tax=Saccoglossus kowalevskii TaxID=10224 RepID=A0ABM0GKE4_SACKO|nr:PREDICTED: transmembrane protein 199-like [Saccoglossus kowalevskii]